MSLSGSRAQRSRLYLKRPKVQNFRAVGILPTFENIWAVMARSEATTPSSWIATARFTRLAMTKTTAQNTEVNSPDQLPPTRAPCVVTDSEDVPR